MNAQPLENLLQTIDAVLERDEVQPEDGEKRFQLVRLLEKAVAAFPTLPKVSFESPAVKICRLLWYKAHADQIDANDVLKQLVDVNPLVRITAAEVVSATLDLPGGARSDPKFFYLLRPVLEQQRAREPSPFIAFRLDDLLDQSARRSQRPRRVTSPALVNPYIAGPPIRDKEKFFGRQDVLREVKTILGEGGGNTSSIVIHGARRTGKTSLLIRIAQGALGETFLPIYVDLQALAGTSLDALLKTLVKLIEAKVPPETPRESKGTIDFPYFWDFLRRTLDQINPRCLVVLFDEYEVLQEYIKDEGVARQLQSLGERDPRLFFIFTGVTRLETLKQKNSILLFDSSRYLKISFLQPEDAYRLITEPVKGIIEFAPGVTDQILELCSGHPFYTQSLCQMLFELVHGRKIAISKDLEQTVRKFLENPAPHLVLSWKALEINQKLVLSALAAIETREEHPANEFWASPVDVRQYLRSEHYPLLLGRGVIRQALSGLREDDWIKKKEREFSYRFAMDLFRRWIGEYRSVWEVLAERRETVLKCAAGWRRRVIGALIDLAILVSLLSITAYYTNAWASHWLAWLVVMYFAGLIALAGTTPGMLLAHLRPLSELGGRLPLLLGIFYGVLVSLPLSWLLTAFFFFNEKRFVTSCAFAGLGVFLACLQTGVAYFGKSRRGLFDKLARAVIIYAQ